MNKFQGSCPYLLRAFNRSVEPFKILGRHHLPVLTYQLIKMLAFHVDSDPFKITSDSTDSIAARHSLFGEDVEWKSRSQKSQFDASDLSHSPSPRWPFEDAHLVFLSLLLFCYRCTSIINAAKMLVMVSCRARFTTNSWKERIELWS